MARARQGLSRFLRPCRNAKITELTRLARTIRRWQPRVLAWHATGLINGPTEGGDLLVKKIKRVSHGFHNFDGYRLRLRLHSAVFNGRLGLLHQCSQPRLVA